MAGFLGAFQAFALTPEEQNTVRAFDQVADSVVFITNVKLAQTFNFDQLEIPRGSGSGFVWDTQGHIVTNFHVVMEGDVFYVTMRDQTRYKAEVVGTEPRKDLAVLRIVDKNPKTKFKPIAVGDSTNLVVGQKAMAIGNPYGLDQTLTTGVVSAIGRQIRGVAGVTIHDVIQTDASINPGNSGGPLIDSSGLLIGMNTAIYSQTGSNAGIGFAVPVSFIKKLVPQLIKHGKIMQPGLGVSIWNDPMARQFPGAVIMAVEPGSAAAQAGLRGMTRNRFGELLIGDVITGIDEKSVKSYDDLYNLMDGHNVGDVVKVKITRDGKKDVVVPVKLQNL